MASDTRQDDIVDAATVLGVNSCAWPCSPPLRLRDLLPGKSLSQNQTLTTKPTRIPLSWRGILVGTPGRIIASSHVGFFLYKEWPTWFLHIIFADRSHYPSSLHSFGINCDHARYKYLCVALFIEPFRIKP